MSSDESTGQRHLSDLPAGLIDTRLALHRLAAYVIGPTRYAKTGRFGLRATPGGFGTPEFEGRRVRVEGLTLVDEREGEVRSTDITTLAAAAEFLGSQVDPETAAEHDTPAAGDVDEPLAVDVESSEYLAAWYSMAFAALGALRSDTSSVDPSEPQLWPGHFDPAIEEGDEARRGSYGASPGDDAIPEPYLYVSAWWPDRLDIDFSESIWNAPGFSGRVLKATDLGDGDPAQTALAFWTETRDLLAAAETTTS